MHMASLHSSPLVLQLLVFPHINCHRNSMSMMLNKLWQQGKFCKLPLYDHQITNASICPRACLVKFSFSSSVHGSIFSYTKILQVFIIFTCTHTRTHVCIPACERVPVYHGHSFLACILMNPKGCSCLVVKIQPLGSFRTAQSFEAPFSFFDWCRRTFLLFLISLTVHVSSEFPLSCQI